MGWVDVYVWRLYVLVDHLTAADAPRQSPNNHTIPTTTWDEFVASYVMEDTLVSTLLVTLSFYRLLPTADLTLTYPTNYTYNYAAHFQY